MTGAAAGWGMATGVAATGSGTRADLEHHCRRRLRADGVDQLGDPAGDVLVDPIDDEAVRREQTQGVAVLDRLQRADPGVELLLRQLGFQLGKTAVP